VEENMADLIYILGLFGFFALAALFVRACDRIIGADPEVMVQGVPGGPEPVDEDRPA
jgi:hypothetical protein